MLFGMEVVVDGDFCGFVVVVEVVDLMCDFCVGRGIGCDVQLFQFCSEFVECVRVGYVLSLGQSVDVWLFGFVWGFMGGCLCFVCLVLEWVFVWIRRQMI